MPSREHVGHLRYLESDRRETRESPNDIRIRLTEEAEAILDGDDARTIVGTIESGTFVPRHKYPHFDLDGSRWPVEKTECDGSQVSATLGEREN